MAGEGPAKERFMVLERQQVDLRSLQCRGLILDIGGGGEGIIGQICAERVVAIDQSKEELEEAPDGPLKVIMDARTLQFLDQTFDTVTAFFVMMYIPPADHRKILKEAYRVLKPGGEIYLWDLVIPVWQGGVQDIYLLPLDIHLPDKLISTGYGTLWPERRQNRADFIQLLSEVGFTLSESTAGEHTFYLKAHKS